MHFEVLLFAHSVHYEESLSCHNVVQNDNKTNSKQMFIEY